MLCTLYMSCIPITPSLILNVYVSIYLCMYACTKYVYTYLHIDDLKPDLTNYRVWLHVLRDVCKGTAHTSKSDLKGSGVPGR